jgi:hypothetical protein
MAKTKEHQERAILPKQRERDIGGTPGFDAPYPCEVFGRPCRAQLQHSAVGHSCMGEVYAWRNWWAERKRRVAKP